jgi:hypothetical protein
MSAAYSIDVMLPQMYEHDSRISELASEYCSIEDRVSTKRVLDESIAEKFLLNPIQL